MIFLDRRGAGRPERPWNDASAIDLPEPQRALVQAIPNGRIIEYDGAAHFLGSSNLYSSRAT